MHELIKQLRDELQRTEHAHCVSVDIFISSDGFEINRTLRTPQSLGRDGISMRNLRGDFIK